MPKPIAEYLELVRFQHTIFALPFALTGRLLGARGLPSLSLVVGVTVAVTGLRTAAMAFNTRLKR